MSSPLHRAFATDKEVEKSGIILQYGVTERNGKEVPINIRIARAGGANTKYAKVFESKTKPYRRMIQTETLDPKIAERLLIETYAESVILGWENWQDAEGDFLEFTVDNVVAEMTALPDLFSNVQRQATEQALFRKFINEEDAKN